MENSWDEKLSEKILDKKKPRGWPRGSRVMMRRARLAAQSDAHFPCAPSASVLFAPLCPLFHGRQPQFSIFWRQKVSNARMLKS